MFVRAILKREAEKIFYEACHDRGYTVKQIVSDKKLKPERNKIIKHLNTLGFNQKLIAELMGIKRHQTIVDILKREK